jgi:hypothetical protein
MQSQCISNSHFESQPSPSVVLPSSQTSVFAMAPSPQTTAFPPVPLELVAVAVLLAPPASPPPAADPLPDDVAVVPTLLVAQAGRAANAKSVAIATHAFFTTMLPPLRNLLT